MRWTTIAVAGMFPVMLLLFPPSAGADGFNDMARTLVEIQESPPAVTFSWNIPTPSTGTLARRALPSTGNPAHASWTILKTIPIGATLVSDYTVVPGVAYEYRVYMASNTRMMYAASGINLPLEEYRGKVLLIVDTTQAAACAAELDVLYRDLVGDGWRVVRLDVPRDDGNYATRFQAASVKSSILTEYNKDPGNVKAVLLFGRVPVPYSGYTDPDGHYTRALPYGADGEEVTAVPHPGYGFTRWSDGSTANPRRDTNIRCYLGFHANYAPSIVTCAIVEPASGLVIRNGSNVTITATATSSLATVSKMDFYQDGVWMGEDLSAPFQFTWLNVPLGNYAFTAKATDSVCATGESAPVYVAATANGLPGRVAATGGTVTNYTENVHTDNVSGAGMRFYRIGVE